MSIFHETPRVDLFKYLKVTYGTSPKGHGVFETAKSIANVAPTIYTDDPENDFEPGSGEPKFIKISGSKYYVHDWTNAADKFQRPTTVTDAYLSSDWGWRTIIHPQTGVKTTSFHEGLDIVSHKGIENTPLHPLGLGMVVLVNDNSSLSCGKEISLYYGSLKKSRYLHLNRIGWDKVQYYKWVKPNDVVGYVGSTGASSGAHLHFAMEITDSADDNAGYKENPNKFLIRPYSLNQTSS